MTKLENMILAIVERLQTITRANGYRTDAGGDVKLGWLALALPQWQLTSELTAVEIDKNTANTHAGNLYVCSQLLQLAVAIPTGAGDPTLRQLDVLADLRQALSAAPDIHPDFIELQLTGEAENELDPSGAFAYTVQPLTFTYQDDFA